MDKGKWGVHESHCCSLHGCKYGDEDCPVENNLTNQKYTCEHCEYIGFHSIEDIKKYNIMQKRIKKALDRGEEKMIVDTEFIKKLLNITSLQ